MSDELDLKEMRRIAEHSLNWGFPMEDPISTSLIKLLNAYDSLKESLILAKRQRDEFESEVIKGIFHYDLVKRINEQLEAKLQIAKDALEEIESHTYSKSPCGIAEKALERIK